MIVVSHPTGNRNVRAVLAALHQQGMLGAFHGTLAIPAAAKWPALLPVRLRPEFERKRYELPAELIHAHPAREVLRMAALRLGWAGWVRHETGPFCVDRVYHGLDRTVAEVLGASRLTGVYAYEDGALASFQCARELGVRRIYDLPIAYWETLRRLIQEERDRLPEWAGTLGGGLSDSPAKLERKTRELELAEMVVTPGSFVADSLPSWARNKVVVQSPFGSPPPLAEELAVAAEQARRSRAAAGQPLRVLFAGSMGQRKGLGDLMAAVRCLGRRDVELVVMGSLQADAGFYQTQCPGFRYETGRPHAQVLELMRSCDVFCLPSIVEGRALVMQEAMSQGLPLIITPNTGGADLVDDGEAASSCSAPGGITAPLEVSDRRGERAATGHAGGPDFRRSATGFLVPIRAPEAIAEALAWCADHRDATVAMGRAARAKAARYTWEAYGKRVVSQIGALFAGA